MNRRSPCGLALDRTGGAAVEFALVLGPLIFLIFGAMEYGRLLWTKQAMQESAIAGARCMGLLASGCASGAHTARRAQRPMFRVSPAA